MAAKLEISFLEASTVMFKRCPASTNRFLEKDVYVETIEGPVCTTEKGKVSQTDCHGLHEAVLDLLFGLQWSLEQGRCLLHYSHQ